MREKISISIDRDILDKVDGLVNNSHIRNRSQAFEAVAKSYFDTQKVSQALILAGGLKKAAKMSLLHATITKLKAAGVSQFFIAGGSNNVSIFEHFGDGSDRGIHITYIKEDRPAGTGGATKQTEKFIDSDFFLVFGDVDFDIKLLDLAKFHRDKGAVVTMSLTTTQLRDSTENISMEGDKIISFEFGARKRSHFCSAGIYVCSPSLFSFLRSASSLEKDVFPKLANEGLLFGYVFSTKWVHD